jgi:serine/threonine protein phosphatase PrpC
MGTHIVGQRRLPPALGSTALDCLTFGVATRPCRGFEVNGDAFIVKRWGAGALAGVIDGLGHGPFAQRAAGTARQFVESHYERPLDELFRGVARVCRPTRGVVMALARFDMRSPNPIGVGRPARIPSVNGQEPSAMRLSFCSIGNIETRVLHSPEPVNLLVRRGVLGGTAPAPLITDHAWDPRATLVLHSDGLGTRWRWEDFPGLAAQPAATIAHRLLQALAKVEDDATVVVIKGTES